MALRSEHDGRYQFQYWAVSLVNANPAQNKKKGADGGVDGIKFFRDLDNGAHKIVVSVKRGKLKADDVRALMAVREREQAEIALLISLDEPRKGMLADAASAGLYTSVNGKMKLPRVQLLTVAGLLAGTQREKILPMPLEVGLCFRRPRFLAGCVEIDAVPPSRLGQHLQRSLKRLADRLGERLWIASRLLQFLRVEIGQAPLREGTARTPAVAVVVDSGNQPRIPRAGDESIEFSCVHARTGSNGRAMPFHWGFA